MKINLNNGRVYQADRRTKTAFAHELTFIVPSAHRREIDPRLLNLLESDHIMLELVYAWDFAAHPFFFQIFMSNMQIVLAIHILIFRVHTGCLPISFVSCICICIN